MTFLEFDPATRRLTFSSGKGTSQSRVVYKDIHLDICIFICNVVAENRMSVVKHRPTWLASEVKDSSSELKVNCTSTLIFKHMPFHCTRYICMKQNNYLNTDICLVMVIAHTKHLQPTAAARCLDCLLLMKTRCSRLRKIRFITH